MDCCHSGNWVNMLKALKPTDVHFDILCYLPGIIVSSLGSIIGFIKDKMIGMFITV